MGSSVRPGVVGWDKGVCILRHRGVHWLTVGQGLLSLQQVRVEEGCFYFFCFFTVIFLSPLSLSFISSTISSISLLTFSGIRYKMTHKGWRVIKPQDNQKPSARPSVDTMRLVSCGRNSSYSLLPIFLKLCRYFCHGLEMCMWFWGYPPIIFLSFFSHFST